MSLAELFLIAAGLSMDAFAVSISDGMVMKRRSRGVFAAAMFGLFQGLMPLAGFFLGAAFTRLVSSYDHYIALAVLGFIGGKMIVESIGELRGGGHDTSVKEPGTAAIFLQAAATSIDALVVGVSFAAIGVQIAPAAGFIAAVTFVISLAGFFGGRRLGGLFGTKASLLGGIVLAAIGMKMFIQHVFFGG